ncbi:hypothetical protein [Streptomyces chiangmaiensis]|uniref:Uncharacterized protein n=1 Tax=Streptomyces chiangmaiensis TaxID=766497 RepID=A0ABU7FNI4_9ACTN|nr:hypothetical protein [Streptomyces chiangmaiensis]MED7825680.1 hypothetical protein [Streptomyces chiangmaiensis]
MARKPSYFEAEDIVIRRLILAHPRDYARFLEEAKAELPSKPCKGCAYLGADALELADLLGHDKQGHQAARALYSNKIRSVTDLRRALQDDELQYLRGQGLGIGGLQRIHDRMRYLG